MFLWSLSNWDNSGSVRLIWHVDPQKLVQWIPFDLLYLNHYYKCVSNTCSSLLKKMRVHISNSINLPTMNRPSSILVNWLLLSSNSSYQYVVHNQSLKHCAPAGFACRWRIYHQIAPFCYVYDGASLYQAPRTADFVFLSHMLGCFATAGTWTTQRISMTTTMYILILNVWGRPQRSPTNGQAHKQQYANARRYFSAF